MLQRVLLLFTIFLFASSSFAQTTLRGRVVDSDGQPLEGAVVSIPELKKGAYTNVSGIYSIDRIPKGDYEVFAYFIGYDTTAVTVYVPESGVVTEGFVLKERIVYTDEVTITGTQTGRIEKTQVTTGVTAISPQEIKLLPSVGGADLAQYLQLLPGVVFTGDQGGQLYIRGGTPIQNMTLVDGMILYSPFHSIGLFSVFDPDYIRTVDVYSAGFGANYGGRISSVIDVKTRSGSVSQTKGKANTNPFSSAVLLEGPLKRGAEGAGLSYLISGRQNYIDKTSPTVYPYVGDSLGLPYRFQDLYGKLTASDGVNYASVFGFSHSDDVLFEFPADISWDALGGGAEFQLLPAEAGAIIRGNFAWSKYNSTLRSGAETFPRASGIQGFNGQLNVGYIFNSVDEFNFGMQFLGFQTDYIFTNSFGFVTEQQSSNTEASVFARYKKVFKVKQGTREFERAVIEPSVRAHYYNNQAVPRLEPRIRAKINFPGLSFSGAAGMYSQNLMAATSDRDVVNLFQGFLSAPTQLGNKIKRTTLQTSWHLLGGVEAELIRNVTTNVEAWYKNFTQLTNINRDKIFPDDDDFITETGTAYGFDFVLKYQSKKYYIYSNYSWAKVTRTDRLDQVEPRTYPTVFDRRHTVNFLGAYRVGEFTSIGAGGKRIRSKFTDAKWELSLRWTLGSGFPFTQTQGYFEKLDFREDGAQSPISTQNGSLGLILSDELNGGRLPYYHRLDFSARRRWVFGNAVLLELDATLVNVYDRNNIFYFDRVRFEVVYQLPILPSLGLTAKF
ncbi:MAG: TonB-dependent receptor [Bacteroidia bacterium]|nr:TonB-dependent receptor [Bacteroidia bacterium]